MYLAYLEVKTGLGDGLDRRIAEERESRLNICRCFLIWDFYIKCEA